MLELDFLPVENEESDSTHSGDAIAMRFTVPGAPRAAVVVTDAGFTDTGDDVVEFVNRWYDARRIDVLISTHPDTDHLNGIKTVLESFPVGELWMHLPWKHDSRAKELGNYERIVATYDAAIANGVTVREPFAGVTAFGGSVTVLGPSEEYYEEQLGLALDEATGVVASHGAIGGVLLAARTILKRLALAVFPSETLTDTDDTSPRNNTSVITLVTADDERVLLTGDAGINAISQAADRYDLLYGSFASSPLTVLQAPHHGSHHNLGPAILDRLVGAPGSAGSKPIAMISSAKASAKHPSPKVTNAFGRRGVKAFATEGDALGHGSNRGWNPAVVFPPLNEDD
jgi:beta-lactamase superfamily II metal-dependent hydrolase